MKLWDALLASAASDANLHCWEGKRYSAAPWRDVVADADQMTAGLRRIGVRPGTAVAAVLANTPLAVRGVLGVWLAGGTLASLPVAARGMSAEEYSQQLSAICRQLGPVALLLDGKALSALPSELGELVQVHTWESVAGRGAVAATPPERDDVAFIQYSSGSTRTPKGCMLSTRAIEAQMDLIEEMMQPTYGEEVGFSWLPLSHDMGMFGSLLSSWSHGTPLALSTPQRFMFAPSTWLTDAAGFGATITGGPDSALRLAARGLRPRHLSQPLRIRVCVVGAERVQAETIGFVGERLQPYGFGAEALMPAYGLAEAVVAVTATPHDEPPRCLTVDSLALADGGIEEVEAGAPSATRIVSAGVPCRDVELPGLGPDKLKEISVRTPSLADGYFGEPELTAQRFRDGGVLTGDLGFVRDGHLYPVGRLDDVVSVGGRSVYTREIEAAVDGIGCTRPGGVAVLETPDAHRLALVLELNRGHDDHDALAEQCAAIAMAKAGVALDECVFLRKARLPRTPSGKVQRHRARQLLAGGRLQPASTVRLRQPAGASR